MFKTLDLALPAGNNVLQIVNNQDAKGTKRQNRSWEIGNYRRLPKEVQHAMPSMYLSNVLQVAIAGYLKRSWYSIIPYSRKVSQKSIGPKPLRSIYIHVQFYKTYNTTCTPNHKIATTQQSRFIKTVQLTLKYDFEAKGIMYKQHKATQMRGYWKSN